MKYYVGFGLTYGNFYIMDKQGDVVWFDKPFNLTRNVIDEFSLDVDLIIEQYVILVNKSFGGIHNFEDFQPDYKNFLKHLRSL